MNSYEDHAERYIKSTQKPYFISLLLYLAFDKNNVEELHFVPTAESPYLLFMYTVENNKIIFN